VPEDAANNIKARIYVYTIDSSRQLRASWAAAGGEILKFGPFESALGGSTQKVDFNTQISVLPAPKINYVYVHLANSSEVSIISHKLKA
jgi:DNA-binding beta-propeller fold protein YncE